VFNPTSEVQNIENRVFQNALEQTPHLQMAIFKTGTTVASGLCVFEIFGPA